jgi:hypothetical protein
MRECVADVVMAEQVVVVPRVVAVVVVVAIEAFAVAALGAIGLRVLALLITPPAPTIIAVLRVRETS